MNNIEKFQQTEGTRAGEGNDAERFYSEAEQLCSGIFWILSDDYELKGYTFLMFGIPCDPDGNPDNTHSIPLNSKSGNSYNHKNLWNSCIKNNNKYQQFCKRDYNYYPRGRVVISHKKAVIYLSAHINTHNFIELIKQKFGLSHYNISKVNAVTDGSGHYKCFLDWD